MNPTIAARRIMRTLFATQSLASAATVAIFPVMTIIGARLSGRPSWAGVPATVYLLGQAFSAYGWGYLMDRLGRRGALFLGIIIGSAGALLAATSIEQGSLLGFLIASLLIGAAVAAVALSRFVAAEVHPPAARARAISNVVLGGTFGAIFGPLLAGAAARTADLVGLEELSGPFVVTFVLLGAAALVVFAFLRPEPREVSRVIAEIYDSKRTQEPPARSLFEILRVPAAFVAIAAMVFGQLIMVMLMVITPLHMQGHDHALTSISFVISVHVAGMFAFSVFSGRLADRFGRGPVIVAGAAILILACFSARLSSQVLPLSVALFLLGLGWNFCYVAGSSLLADQLSVAERGQTQGFNDLLIGLTSAAGGLGSGIVFAAIGYGAMALVGAVVALLPLFLAAWLRARIREVPAVQITT